MPSLDRSRIESRRTCPTYRYLHYHKNATGLQQPIPSSVFAIGLIVHKGLEILLTTGDITKATGGDVDALLLEYFPLQDRRFLEMQALCKGLIYGWYKERYDAIMQDYRVLGVEKTFTWKLGDFDYNFRVDALLERVKDGRLAILDFKTAKKPDDEWARMFEHNLQPILYTTAIDDLYQTECIGMIFEGLSKGYPRYENGKTSPYYGQMIHYSPFCYGYAYPDGYGIDYVKGAKKVPSWEIMPHDLWYNTIIAPNTKEPLFIHVPPLKPSPHLRSTAIRSITQAELEFHERLDKLKQISETNPELTEYYEDLLFEKYTSSCLRYGAQHKCQFYDICWVQGVRSEPFENGYISRVPNYQEDEG